MARNILVFKPDINQKDVPSFILEISGKHSIDSFDCN